MKQRTRIVVWVYLVGALAFELLLLWNAYDNGGFQRHHTAVDLTLIGAIHITSALLWPVFVMPMILQLEGVLPRLL